MDSLFGHALYGRFLRGLAIAPDREAIRVGAQAVTYRTAHRLALLWSGSLLAAAPEPPKAIGVLTARGTHSYVAILACLYAGAAVVPLQPDFPVVRTRRMLDAAGVSALIVDDRGHAIAEELLGPTPSVPMLVASGQAGAGTIVPDPAYTLHQPRPAAAADTAYMLFTSGSTGRPKGVPITHGNTSHYFQLLDARYGFTSDDVFSQTFNLNFDGAMFDLFCAWGAGASLVWVPPRAYRDMPRFLAEQGITVWFSTPNVISLVRRMGGLAPGALPTLRWSFFGGEALKCQDAVDWRRAAPDSAVENLYGPTELTVAITGHRWSDELSPLLAVNGVVPIGALHEGHELLLLDAGGDRADTEGELCVTGPQLTRGYLDPSDDKGRFLVRHSRRWYRTGDRVRRLGNGELAYLGRMDAQVQVQGWRIELAEIDHALRTCGGVENAVTTAVPVDNGVELVVFYTGDSAPPVELVRQLRKLLPQQMVPKHYQHLREFPLNSNQKIDRPKLRSHAQDLLAVATERR